MVIPRLSGSERAWLAAAIAKDTPAITGLAPGTPGTRVTIGCAGQRGQL
jgi:hypothetical protein